MGGTKYRTLEEYEAILSEIPFDILEEHYIRRKQEAEDFMRCW